MTERVSEAFAESARPDDVPRDLVERLARHARPYGGDRRAVRLHDECVHPAVQRRAALRRNVPRHVGAVSAELHAHVDKNAVASVPHRPVRNVVALRGVCADAYYRVERLAVAALEHHGADDPRHLALGHPRAEHPPRVLPYRDVEVARRAHLRDLVRGLHRATPLERARSVRELRPGKNLLQLLEIRD